MFFTFTNPKHFSRVSKRLEEILPKLCPGTIPSRFRYVDALAVTLGFNNYPHYQQFVSSKNEQFSLDDRRDESLSTAELDARRAKQAENLAQYLKKFGLNLPAETLIAQWRPTAARPQYETLTTDHIEQHQEEGLAKRVQTMLTAIELGQLSLAEENLKDIHAALKSGAGFLKDWMPLSVGTIAVSLAESSGTRKKDLAIKLFELLVEIGFTPANFHLAQALTSRLGADSEEDKARIYQLHLRVKKALDDGEKVFESPLELGRYYTCAGLTLLESTKSPNKTAAFELFLKGAEMGCPKSAYALSLIYSDRVSNEEKALFHCEEIAKDRKKEKEYYQLAIKNGYDPISDTFREKF